MLVFGAAWPRVVLAEPPAEEAADSVPNETKTAPAPVAPTLCIVKLTSGTLIKGWVIQEVIGSHLIVRALDGRVARIEARDIVAIVPLENPQARAGRASAPALDAAQLGAAAAPSAEPPSMTSYELDHSEQTGTLTKPQKGALLVVAAHVIQIIGAGMLMHGIVNAPRGQPFVAGGAVVVVMGNGLEVWGWAWAGSPSPRRRVRLGVSGVGASVTF